MDTKTELYQLRKQYNLTQQEMAQKLFVTRQAVSRWEQGKTIPNIETLRLISKIFNVSINSLVDVNILNDNKVDKINSDRFLGFAKIYESSRPAIPEQACNFILDYLESSPEHIIDLGCGTGLSTLVWKDKCNNIIGIDPSKDMLSVAKQKSSDNIKFIQAYSDDTGLPNNYADIVVCSQSFHWMNPYDTLNEVNRILKVGGVFAAIDCDWPPVCNWKAEQAYNSLLNKVRIIEQENNVISKTFQRWDKNNHLKNISECGYFRYSREITLSSKVKCNSEKFIGIAFSQGGLQTILKTKPDLIEKDVELFEEKIKSIYGNSEFDVNFCYRMRIGIK